MAPAEQVQAVWWDNGRRGLVRADRLPEIRRSDARIEGELGARALDRELAGFQHVAVIGDLQRGSRVLLDQQYRYAGCLERGDDIEDLLHDQRREAQAPFDEHQELRLR